MQENDEKRIERTVVAIADVIWYCVLLTKEVAKE